MPTPPTRPLTEKLLPKHGNRKVKFRHRDDMRRRGVTERAHIPIDRALTPPVTPLPVDCTNGEVGLVYNLDDNDNYGTCGPAKCDHINNIRTYGQGKPGFAERTANVPALLAQYLKISGGDNGTDEADLIGPGGIWVAPEGIANDPAMIVVDALDIDLTNIPLVRYCIDQFYAVSMAWSVPDAFLDDFAHGVVFADAGIPDPANGHYTPLTNVRSGTFNGVDVTGFYDLPTWGDWCVVSPKFVASVQPQGFVSLSPTQFNALGYDSRGRHVSTQAAKWIAIGGNAAKANALASKFPPVAGPVVPPPPPPPPPPPNPMANLVSILGNAYLIPNVAEATLLNNPGNGEGVLWYSPSTGIVTPSKTLTAEQVESMTRLSAINWSQIIKDIETILAIIAAVVPPPAPTPKAPYKSPFPSVATKLGAFLVALGATVGTVSYAGGQSGQAPGLRLANPPSPPTASVIAPTPDRNMSAINAAFDEIDAQIEKTHAKQKARPPVAISDPAAATIQARLLATKGKLLSLETAIDTSP